MHIFAVIKEFARYVQHASMTRIFSTITMRFFHPLLSIWALPFMAYFHIYFDLRYWKSVWTSILLSSSHISYSSQQPLSISIFTIGIFDYFNTTTMKEMNSDRHFDLLPVSFAGFSLHHSRYIYFLFSTCTKQSIILCYLFRFFIYKMHLRLHNGDIVKY